MHKKILLFLIIIIVIISMIVLKKQYKRNNIQENVIRNEIQQGFEGKENEKVKTIKIKINNNVLEVNLESNLAVEALIKKLKNGDITINAYDYGDFEKVGDLGFELPTSDVQTRTTAGDLMLYQGNQITLFYGSNSWKYTKIGKIIGVTENELKNILGTGDVTLILSID